VRQLALARRSASGSATAPVLATLDLVENEIIDCTPPSADCWAQAAVDVSTTLGRDKDALGRICGDRWRNRRGGIGGSSGDRGHVDVPSSSTAEPHNEECDGTWATCSSLPKKWRTEPDASPEFQSGVHCSGGPQSGQRHGHAPVEPTGTSTAVCLSALVHCIYPSVPYVSRACRRWSGFRRIRFT